MVFGQIDITADHFSQLQEVSNLEQAPTVVMKNYRHLVPQTYQDRRKHGCWLLGQPIGSFGHSPLVKPSDYRDAEVEV